MLPSLPAIREARERTRDVVRHTPLLPLHEHFGATDLYVKVETLQPVGSFKIRGVFNAVAALSPGERAKGVGTVSAGNTAQALAFAARWFGVSARSVMPDSAPRTKIEAVRAWGGEPVLVPTVEVFRYLKERAWEHEPHAFIHPWTNRDLMTGHASLGLEIVEDLPDVDTIVVPVGGGGLLAGVGAALRAVKPGVTLVAVEPAGCPSLYASLEAGRPVEVDCRTLCDGVAVPYVTEEMYPVLRELAGEVLLVPDDAVVDALRRLLRYDKLLVEPSGALSVAAALGLDASKRGKTVCLLTGGSIDEEKLVTILER